MGFYLLDRRNPHGDRFYTSRREPLLAIVVHVTAGAEDLDTINDLSAENVAAYAATTDRQVSWHTGSDADSWVDLLPSEYTAWHASDYNSCTHGHEISKRTTDWRNVPAVWVDKTLRMAALGPNGQSGLRAIALKYGIPLRWATKAELDAQRANYRAGRPWKPVGFITHAEVQWSDRRDPGYITEGGRVIDTFPRDRFMGLLNLEDDVSAQDVWYGVRIGFPGEKYTAPPAEWVPSIDKHISTVRFQDLPALRALMQQVLAAVTNDPDITPEFVERTTREAAVAAAREQAPAVAALINAQIVDLVEDALRRVQDTDNLDEAKRTADALLERIASLVPDPDDAEQAATTGTVSNTGAVTG